MNIEQLFSKIDLRQFYLLLGGFLLLVTAASASAFVLPEFKKYRQALADNAGVPPLPASSQVLQSVLGEREQTVAERSRALHGDMANLPLREVEAYVIDRLQGIAWNHDVELQGVRPAVGETINTFREVLFRLEVEGRYHDLFRWLQELRRELGFIVIKEYRMSRRSGQTEEPELLVQMTLASYRKEAP